MGFNSIKHLGSALGFNSGKFGSFLSGGPTAGKVLADGSTMLWVDSSQNVTKDGANKVSVWGDKSGEGNDLLQATGAAQPLWSTNGILFDGVDDFMKAIPFTLVQPEMVYIVFKQVTWTLNDRFFDGEISPSMLISQYATSPALNMYGGSDSLSNSNLPLNTFGILRALYDGANSKFIINDTTPITGNVGTNNAGGFTLAKKPNSTQFYSNIEVKEVIVRKVADSAEDEALIYQYLSDKYLPTVEEVLASSDTVLWVDSEENVTKDASNLVSVWGDKSGEGNNLLQATGSAQPLWSTNGILFDGVNDFLKAAAFTLVQPEMIYIVFKQVTGSGGRILAGDGNNTMLIYQMTGDNISLFGGANLGPLSLPLNTFGIVRALYNGVDSKFIINDTTPLTGDGGVLSGGGFTLGKRGFSTSHYSNIEVKEIIVRKVADSVTNEDLIYQYLSDKYLPTVEEVLASSDTVLWVDSEENVTKDASNLVSVWGDKSGNGNDLLQATGSAQPLYSTNGILFDGVNDFLKAAAFTLVQPEMIYIVVKQVSWTLNDRIYDGDISPSMLISQASATPALNMYGGGSLNNANLPLNTFGIVRCLYDGANSKFIINDTSPITGNVGTNNAGGFTLARKGDLNANFGNIEVKEIIIRKVADSVTNEALIYQYLSDKYLPTAEEVLADGSTMLWVDSQENVTKDASNKVSVWGDKSGEGNDLLQATGSAQPLWSTNGILFDGVNDFMKALPFTLVQPEMVYIVFKQTWSYATRVFDGDSINSMVLSQFQTTPSLNMQVSGYSSSLSVKNTNLPVNTFGIARCLYDGVNSKFIIDDTTPVTGSVSTLSAGGFTLGTRAIAGHLFSNIEVKEIIIRKVADSAEDEALIYQYLSNKYGI